MNGFIRVIGSGDEMMMRHKKSEKAPTSGLILGGNYGGRAQAQLPLAARLPRLTTSSHVRYLLTK